MATGLIRSSRVRVVTSVTVGRNLEAVLTQNVSPTGGLNPGGWYAMWGRNLYRHGVSRQDLVRRLLLAEGVR